MSDLIHWLYHTLGCNTGQVVSTTDEDGDVWVGYQCDTCGAIEGRCIALRKEEQPQ